MPSELVADRGPSAAYEMVHPTARHTADSFAALRSIAQVLADVGEPSGREIEVSLRSIDHQGFLQPLLYVFHLSAIDDNGLFVNEIETGRPVTYAVLINNPVAVQVETAISHIATLIERQRYLASTEAARLPLGQLPETMDEADDSARNEVVDVLRHGWMAAAQRVARMAAEAGIRLRVRHCETPLSRAELLTRGSLLRHTYNTYEMARQAIDRVVNAIAGKGLLAVSPEQSDLMAEIARRRLNLNSSRHYFAQAMRDALVYGNGFVAFSTAEPLGQYNLDPVRTELVDDKHALDMATGALRAVLHFEGLRQPGSVYGLGLLEAVLPHVLPLEVAREGAEMVFSRIPEAERRARPTLSARIDSFGELVAVTQSRFNTRIEQLFPASFTQLEPASPDLYFPGHDRLHP